MKIVLISCVKKKADKPCKAKDMYQSDWFKKAYTYAKNKNPDKIFILSAKYGVLGEDDMIEPYDLTLNKMHAAGRQNWAKSVIGTLRKCTNIKEDEFIILAGKKYREGIVGELCHYTVPMENLSQGQQLRYLKENI